LASGPNWRFCFFRRILSEWPPDLGGVGIFKWAPDPGAVETSKWPPDPVARASKFLLGLGAAGTSEWPPVPGAIGA
jgi:hypothetical protein